MALGIETDAGLSKRDFDEICQLAYRNFGLDLKPGKEALVAARLGKRIRALHLAGFKEYMSLLHNDTSGKELTALIDSLTTNHTSFLRESAHFDLLRTTILPQLRSRPQVTVWSAGCSTGEEPYSILFYVNTEWGRAEASKFRVLATDISTRALDAAKLAVYPQDRFSSVPREWLPQIVQKGSNQWSGHYRIRPELRSAVEFRRVNLMEPFEQIGHYPVIFCRNVMIYFDKTTQENLVRRFSAQLEPGGYLLIGHSEGLTGVKHELDYVCPAVYRRPGKLASTGTAWRNS